MVRKKLASFGLLMCLFAVLVKPETGQAKTYRVCTVEIVNALTADKKGPQPLFELYEQIIRLVNPKSEHEFDLLFAPAARCMELFERKQIDFMWPFIIVEERARLYGWNEGVLPVYAMPIIMGGHYVFTRQSDPKIDNVSDLEGKTVVSARGYGVPKALETNNKINKQIVNRNDLIPEMITRGRVSAGILQTGWVQALEKQGLLDGLHHGRVIDFWGGSFTFQPTEEGKELASKFTTAILKLVTRGTYKKIMNEAPYYIPSY